MRRRARGKAERLSPEMEAWLHGEAGECMESLLANELERRGYWQAYREAVLSYWESERPGGRPCLWWQYDNEHGPRARVGGSGLTYWEAGEPWIPYYECGIPSRDSFKSIAPGDPPRFESQATFLRRHGLLSPAEERSLKDRPEAWEPEIIAITNEQSKENK
jgi:hypothetical protein